MRKIALCKKYGKRDGIFKMLRQPGTISTELDRKGNLVCLNYIKHLAYKGPYKNLEYQSMLVRAMRSQQQAAIQRAKIADEENAIKEESADA